MMAGNVNDLYLAHGNSGLNATSIVGGGPIRCMGAQSTLGGGSSCIGNPIDHNAICADLNMVYDATKKLCVAKPTTGGGSGSGSVGTGSGGAAGSGTSGGVGTGSGGNSTTPATSSVTDQVKAALIVAVILWVVKSFASDGKS